MYPKDLFKHRAHAFWPDAGGVAFKDTWAYDSVKNEWRELKPTTSPLKIHSARDMTAYDVDRKVSVFYDVSSGVWAWRSGAVAPAKIKARTASLPKLTAKEPPKVRVKDSRTEAWPPESRYKALASGKGGLKAYQSADAIHWSPIKSSTNSSRRAPMSRTEGLVAS